MIRGVTIRPRVSIFRSRHRPGLYGQQHAQAGTRVKNLDHTVRVPVPLPDVRIDLEWGTVQ